MIKKFSYDNYLSIKELIDTGIKEKQAEKILAVTKEIVKYEISPLPKKEEVEHLTFQIQSLRSELDKLELRLTIKLGSIVAVIITLFISILRNLV